VPPRWTLSAGTVALPVAVSAVMHVGLFAALILMPMAPRPLDSKPRVLLSEGDAVFEVALVPRVQPLEPDASIKPVESLPEVFIPPQEVMPPEPTEPVEAAPPPPPPPEPEATARQQQPARPPERTIPPPPVESTAPPQEETSEKPTPPPRAPKPAEPADTGVERGASLVELPSPQYPNYCRKRGQEGTVVLEVEVLADGTAGEIRVVQASRYSRLTTAAVEAARRARFAPALRDGRAVVSTVTIPFRFELHGAPR